MAKTSSDSIVGVIRKESWILDHFETSTRLLPGSALARSQPATSWSPVYSKKPKMVLPPSEQHCLGGGVRALTAF